MRYDIGFVVDPPLARALAADTDSSQDRSDVSSAESITESIAESITVALTEALTEAMARLDIASSTGIGVLLSDDETLHRLNRDHRGVDRTTDVLSFRSADESDGFVRPPDEGDPYLGDLAISVPQAAHGAAQAGHALIDELRLLAVHGLLHLIGHDDATEEGAKEMERIERELGVRT